MAQDMKNPGALWARLAVDYYRDPKIIEVGPVAELAYIRLIALARETIRDYTDGEVPEVLARRELREVFDLAATGQDDQDLFVVLEDAKLIERHDRNIRVLNYATWQTTQDELTVMTRRKA